MIADIIGGMSTAEVISVITEIIDLYDGTGPDFVGSPATAVPKLNEIALAYNVATINDVESGANAMIKINNIKAALEQVPPDFSQVTYNGQPVTYNGQTVYVRSA